MQKGFKSKAFIKPKAMKAFIESKTSANNGEENFSLAKIELNNYVLEKYNTKHYKKIVEIIKERIINSCDKNTCFCQTAESEILIFLGGNYSEAELSEIGWQIIAQCCGFIDTDDLKVSPGLNAGLAIYPDSGRTYADLIASLNIAVVVAKKEGVNTYSVYTPKLSPEKSKVYKQLAGVKDALNKNQFLLHYQPIIDLMTGDVVGVESLLRWNHPVHGIVATGNFFDDIEASGEIYRLGLWTFEQMLQQRQLWSNFFFDRQFFYHVNLSAKQLINTSLIEDIKRITKKFPNINAREICFEVSGVTAMLKDETILNNIMSLRSSGFSIAIDNFVNSEMNAEELLRLPINVIKIIGDRCDSVVEHEKVANLIATGSSLGVSFIAQGIENNNMLSCAQGLGIKFAQGYFFAKPNTAEECMKSILSVPWRH